MRSHHSGIADPHEQRRETNVPRWWQRRDHTEHSNQDARQQRQLASTPPATPQRDTGQRKEQANRCADGTNDERDALAAEDAANDDLLGTAEREEKTHNDVENDDYHVRPPVARTGHFALCSYPLESV